jgi:hypothetical protein
MDAVIVATARTPIGRAGKGSLIECRPDDLSADIIRALLAKVPALDPGEIEDVIWGTAQPAGEGGYNMARVVALLAGLDKTPGTTVNRYCSSSLQTIRMAAHAIKAGEGDVFISAGVETVSRYMNGAADTGPHNTLFTDAEAHAREAIKIDSDRVPAYSLLAMAFVRQDKWIDVDATLAEAEKQVPDNLTPYFRAGVMCLSLKIELPRAERYIRKYLSQEPEPSAPTHANAHWRLGVVLEQQGRDAIAASSIKPHKITVKRALDMRYVGQEHPVTVELPISVFARQDRKAIKKHFDDDHLQRYGTSAPNERSEIVSLRVTVAGLMKKPPQEKIKKGSAAPPKSAFSGKRPVSFDGKFRDAPTYKRAELLAGNKINGPALIEEHASTTVLMPRDRMTVDAYGNLVIKVAGAK